jgi:thiamine-phosphate pyrophosphorylase
MHAAISAGIRFFQYRSKHSSRRDIYDTSLGLAAIARKSGALFIVNDHADIAAACGAHGVHLGQDDLPLTDARRLTGPDMFIGISTHSREQARNAEAAGADYIGFGPVFPTTTKDAGRTQGIGAVTSIRQAVSIPVIAIGGITRDNLEAVLNAGADGIAVISAILRSPDIGRAAAELAAVTNKSLK